MNSPEKVTQSVVIEMELFDDQLIYWSRKMLFLKLNENYETSLKSVTNYSDQIFVEQLRSIKCFDY